MRLILASASPRRAELLRAAGFQFETIAADVDESVRAGETPQAYVRRLAAEKTAALVGTDGTPKAVPYDSIVIGADTTVVVDGAILGKPRDDGEAAAMLRRLSGRSHEVMTGVSVRHAGREVEGVEITTVHVAPLGDADIEWYVSSGEGRDKAGGYAIQGLASRFVPRIEGSYTNVVGLPVARVAELIRKLVPDFRHQPAEID